MTQQRVSIVAYEKPQESVRKAVALANGFDHLPAGASVFIKPNIVFWTHQVEFPKYGVITTSRVVEDMILLLREKGIRHITIGEGIVTRHPKDTTTAEHAFEALGYHRLQKKYGVRCLNVMTRPFEKVDLGHGAVLAFNRDILQSDFVINLPVMKTHNQTRVSLGIKNLKGLIDIPSRKRCHSADDAQNLHWWVARLADKLPPMLTLYDGIYTNERGPSFDGKLHRSNILMAATDVLAGDMVGARVLGQDPADIPHLVYAAENHHRGLDMNTIQVVGLPVDKVARPHAWNFKYSDRTGGSLPLPMARKGISGINYPKFDTSLCTYCSAINGVFLTAISHAWDGKAFDKVEVLTGKKMVPSAHHNHTILLGKCMYKAHRHHPNINHMIAVKGCPPEPKDLFNALTEAGIAADPNLFKEIDTLPGLFMQRYQKRADFDDRFFQVE